MALGAHVASSKPPVFILTEISGDVLSLAAIVAVCNVSIILVAVRAETFVAAVRIAVSELCDVRVRVS